jgi:hypothetical protein
MLVVEEKTPFMKHNIIYIHRTFTAVKNKKSFKILI